MIAQLNKSNLFDQWQEKSINDRVLVLSQKINSMNLNTSIDMNRKAQNIENMCEEVENQLDQYRNLFREKTFDIQHYLSKVDKEVNRDWESADRFYKERISMIDKNMKETINAQNEERKSANTRILRFIDEQSTSIKQILELETQQRQEQGRQIESSLSCDLGEISQKTEEAKQYWNEQLEKIEEQFIQDSEKLQAELMDHCNSYSNNEADFYKMLRDIVKKTKDQIKEHRSKREQTEEQILLLIEKMCEKVLKNLD